MDVSKSKQLLKDILQAICNQDGSAALDRFSSLRSVDAKVRDAKTIIEAVPGVPAGLLKDFQNDEDFKANSRRVRLESLANYCNSALKFLESGAVSSKKKIFPAPDMSRLTATMPGLSECLSRRWIEAQKGQHTGAYLSAVVMMGSILEGLLLARATADTPAAYRASACPKDKIGKAHAIHDWKLSALIDVAVELKWIKTDRGKFSHALRDSRNIVHPWAELTAGANFDEATCKTCWHVLNAAVEDLLASVT